jgi:hypothetical protein
VFFIVVWGCFVVEAATIFLFLCVCCSMVVEIDEAPSLVVSIMNELVVENVWEF